MTTLEIFIPFWGPPELFTQTVNSVLAQSDGDWRLTVLDDHYPDVAPGRWVESLDDPRISYVRHPVNIGITENYREAVRRSTSDHLVLLGCDDLLHPNYVEVVKRVARAVPDADVIAPGVTVIDEHGHEILPLADRVKQKILTPRGAGIAVLRGERMATSLIRGDWLYWPALAFRTQTLRATPFRDGLPIIQDLAVLMDIAFADGSLAFTPTTAFSYRRYGGSASQRTLVDGSRFRDERRFYRDAAEAADKRGWRRTARTARLRILSRLHAATEIPALLRHRSRAGLDSALAHVFAP
ncbi:glycosyltransferase [Microbacterium sp. NPDC089189]|uniref:glycosyltransferase n=1 Tax=Microbacterium sp. NPDC089189 TaxID=3154972 RepID=UPI00343FB896